MPVITRADGRRIDDGAEAAAIIGALGLGVSRLELPPSEELAAVQEAQKLDTWHAAVILSQLVPQLPTGYAGRDVIALFPSSQGLDGILAAYCRCHVHDDDEVRLILAGEGVFGFVLPGGDQVEISVAAGDLIAVPAGAEHWFRLGESATIVAIRLFGANPDWQARYTDTPIRFIT